MPSDRPRKNPLDSDIQIPFTGEVEGVVSGSGSSGIRREGGLPVCTAHYYVTAITIPITVTVTATATTTITISITITHCVHYCS